MSHLLIIVAFVTVYVSDELPDPVLYDRLGPIGAIAGATLPLAWLWVMIAFWVQRCIHRMDVRHDGRAIRSAERACSALRIGSVVLHVAGVHVFGLLHLVRRVVGDLILVDELITLLPVVLGILSSYWLIYPVERRVREVLLVRDLDEGRPVHPFPSRMQFVWSMARLHVVFMAVPIALIMGWGELVRGWAAQRWGPGIDAGPGAIITPMIQLTGAIAIFVLLPPLLRRLWDTVSFESGPLRTKLEGLCRAHRVRVRDLLIWRTGGLMINGAVLGLLGPLRYIILTDALVEQLPEIEVEAVTAHEIGHVRRRHMLWLAVAVLATVSVVGVGVSWLSLLTRWLPIPMAAIEIAASLVTLASTLVVLGFVSRRFEWQADAFAVQHLSGMTARHRDATITPEAVAAMSGALRSVATLNGVPLQRFSWRHGSIDARLRRLARLSGRRADRVSADREAAATKAVSLVMLMVGGLMLGLDVLLRAAVAF